MALTSSSSLSFTMNHHHQAPSHFKPGKTVNKHERHYVIHNYHDYANEPDDPSKTPVRRRKGGVTTPFPVVLHRLLCQVERDGLSHIFGWQPHGRCFVIFQPKAFVQDVMPKYFKLGKLSSFQRQLNLYGFNRITRGKDATGYYHEYFLRHREYLAKRILRKRIKGTKIKGACNPDLEPDFYKMPPVAQHIDPNAPTVVSSDDHSSSSSSSSHASETNESSSSSSDNVVCNFVFPKFALQTSATNNNNSYNDNVHEENDNKDDDPVDALLQETTNGGAALLPSPTAADGMMMHMKDWELQDAVLGQYLIFDEDQDNFEAV